VHNERAADGLAEDTIVFFFSDHGMGMPRGKRCLYDSGLRVPLVVRFPAKWSHLAPAAAGASTDRLVSFVDFAPTVLSLCGVASPKHFQGRVFLGPDAGPPRESVFGARDRVDEALDVSRSVRDSRWLYIRNYMPHLSWMQPEGYSDQSVFRQHLKQLAAAGKLSNGALQYAQPRRALEELYDCQADPHQLHNLATAPEHLALLEKMRKELRRWQLETRDLGFVTEPQIREQMAGRFTPWDVGQTRATYPLERLLEAAGAVDQADAAGRQRLWLTDGSDAVRYWAAVGLAAREGIDDSDRTQLRAALHDASAVVRIEAAATLARSGDAPTALPVLSAALEDKSLEVILHAARALELLGTVANPVRPQMQAALDAARRREAAGDEIAMFVRFSLEAALAK
jgi:hypothetical protein